MQTISLPFLDPTGNLTPAVITAMLAGATSAIDPNDRTRIILTFASQAARDNFASSISLPAQKRYWGVSSKPSLTAPEIVELGNSETATGFAKTIIYDCNGGRYPYFVYPAIWGTPIDISVGGLGFSDVVVTDVTDADGSDVLRVIRFASLQNGSRITVGWA